MRPHLARSMKLILPLLLIIALALVLVLPALAEVATDTNTGAAPDCSSAGAIASATSNAGETVRVYAEAGVGGLSIAKAGATTTNGLAEAKVGANADPSTIATAVGDSTFTNEQTFGGPADGTCYAIALVYVNGKLVECSVAGDISCPSAGGYSPVPPPGIWSSHVCEPFDGFSGDGWSTFASDANQKPYGSTLYVAADAAGPWFETGFLQSPYVISHDQMDALTAMLGLTDYHQMWFRPGPNGTPANVGSMLADREAIMDALCGT